MKNYILNCCNFVKKKKKEKGEFEKFSKIVERFNLLYDIRYSNILT